jgi:hypothetical protein
MYLPILTCTYLYFAERRVELMPAENNDHDINESLFDRALRHDRSDYAGSDVDAINTTESEWSTEVHEESFEVRNPIVVPDDAPLRPRRNPFVDTDEEDDRVRVRVINYRHLPPHYHPTLTLTLPENLPELRRGQALVIPLKMTLQIAHPDDVADL